MSEKGSLANLGVASQLASISNCVSKNQIKSPKILNAVYQAGNVVHKKVKNLKSSKLKTKIIKLVQVRLCLNQEHLK
jgi:hypothetical protein